MKKRLIELVAAGLIALPALATTAAAQAIFFEQHPDPVIFNADPDNQKQRPFIVDKDEYPFKSHWFEKDGVSMHYVDEGEGFPIVLTHGNPDWSFLNRNIIKGMSGEARVIAYDLPGFGFSDTPEGFNWTPQEHAEWISALVNEHLKLEKYIIVVQDWGGPTGLWVASGNPEKVAGMVISNTWAWKSDGMNAEFSMQMRQPEMQRKLLDENLLPAVLMPSLLNEKSRENKAITDAYVMPFPTPASRMGTAVFPQQITLAEPWLEELGHRMESLSDKPVELIFGLKDDFLGNENVQKRWRSMYPDATVHLLPDAGHFSQEDSPESFVFSLKRLLQKIEPTD